MRVEAISLSSVFSPDDIRLEENIRSLFFHPVLIVDSSSVSSRLFSSFRFLSTDSLLTAVPHPQSQHYFALPPPLSAGRDLYCCFEFLLWDVVYLLFKQSKFSLLAILPVSMSTFSFLCFILFYSPTCGSADPE